MENRLSITILGTGTSQGVPVIGCDCEVCRSSDPRDKRLRTSALLAYRGKYVNIDIGPDFRQQMLRARPGYLDAILMTHEHNDHTAGLDDVRPFNFMRRQNMPVYGLPRVLDALRERYPYVFTAEPYPGAPRVLLYPIDGNSRVEVAGMTIQPIHILHGRLPILGFRVGDFAYLTDVKSIPDGELKKLQGLHTLVINALHYNEHPTHLNVPESLAFIEQVRPVHAYLTHMSHRMGRHQDIEARLPTNVRLAYDGLTLTAPYR